MSLTAPQKPLPEFHFVNRGSVPWWRAGKGFQADIVPIAMQEAPTGVLDPEYNKGAADKELDRELRKEGERIERDEERAKKAHHKYEQEFQRGLDREIAIEDRRQKKEFKEAGIEGHRNYMARLKEDNALIALKNKKDKAEAKKLAARERADERTKARKDRAEARR
jgi:hypothetical protein